MSFLSRYEDLGQSFNPEEVELKPALRINTLKGEKEQLVTRLQKKKITLTPVPFINHAQSPVLYYQADFSLGATPEYLQGLYYLQEAASCLPPLVLNPERGDTVLDMAAAPGSKTTQIAQMMFDDGVIIALDTEIPRLKSLRNNIERLGIKSVACYKKDARFVSDLKMSFDKILLDAPCSGNFCIEKNFFSTKTLDGIQKRARLQKELLKSAYKVLKSKGTLVYSTCSLEPEENEFVLDWFLENFKDMHVEKTDLDIGDDAYTTIFSKELNKEIAHAKRLWPHKTGTQGFFIAKLVKD